MAMKTTMATTTKTCECDKCGGTGHIDAFRGIANGVCFRCNGTGKVAYRASKAKVAPLTPYLAGVIEKIKTADLSALSFEELSKLRTDAHWPTPHCPNLLEIWRERGEEYFQAAQAEKLQEFYASRGW